jgi:large subunit ribosomal protein L24
MAKLEGKDPRKQPKETPVNENTKETPVNENTKETKVVKKVEKKEDEK